MRYSPHQTRPPPLDRWSSAVVPMERQKEEKTRQVENATTDDGGPGLAIADP
ncbi:hypothetical protein CBOM_03148 [Ceraceosorus bombacis]|uniref:Uncharacterized protein n=1 Tax=Ceraceosorus bombacis TaxID=401625 RepID=A0A0P1BKX0_9BASI|nr:hypothetical protein CBOM_03148 [Ceraceosorus bombacis]